MTSPKKLLSLFLCLALAGGVSAQTAKKTESGEKAKTETAKSAADKSGKSAKKTKPVERKGLFNVTADGDNWFFSIPDTLLGREILVTVRYTSTPANTGQYGGEQANQQTVYFEKSPSGKLLLRSRLLINAADSTDAINRAIVISNADPIISALKIESHTGGRYKVKVNQLFMEDNPALGMRASTKQAMGLQGLVADASYIESIKTFPLNTEVRTVKTWTSSGSKTAAAAYTGKVTLGLNVSFVLLPKTPMAQRLFDPRVGYFTDDYTLFSDNQQRVEPRRFITRWRLEPKDSADAERMKRGELVEPKKPIVYYIDPATPKQWRPYLIQGVNDWQKAFEKAGFKNAIMAKEWPENDSTMSMEDARYSCIRYLASPTENAYGPNVHDPRSGEILESHICWYHNVMTLVHDWYMVQAGTLDEAAQCMKFDTDLMGQLIRFVSSHEVGHTLGLRHNFGSSSTVPVDSLRSKAFVEAHGHTPSIMDYARFNYVAQPEDSISRVGLFPRIGDYDCWAIEWGYTPMWNAYDAVSDHWELEKLTTERLRGNRRLWFGDGETNRTNDSRCQTEDLGDDAVKASEYGILNLKRELPHLPEWTYESGDIYGSNLKGMYSAVYNQFYRYCRHVLGNIGGLYCDYKTVDETGAVYTDAPLAKQTAALDFLTRHILTEPTWLTKESYMDRVSSDKQSLTTRLGRSMVASMLSEGVLDRLRPVYPAEEYLPEVVTRIFSEATSAQKPTAYRMELQKSAVSALVSYFKTNKSGKAYATVLQQLRRLQRVCNAASAQPHFAALADTIDRALVVK